MSFLTQPISIQALLGKGRRIDSINVQVVTTESTNDTLTITKQPVQQGASITDHAYKEPTTFSMQILFTDNLSLSLSKIYDDLIQLQLKRLPIDVITPKRIYHNMLISSLGQTTDKATENCLSISISFQEIIIVNIVTTQLPRRRQKKPAVTGATQPAGRKPSSLLSGARAFAPGIKGVSK